MFNAVLGRRLHIRPWIKAPQKPQGTGGLVEHPLGTGPPIYLVGWRTGRTLSKVIPAKFYLHGDGAAFELNFADMSDKLSKNKEKFMGLLLVGRFLEGKPYEAAMKQSQKELVEMRQSFRRD